MAYRRRTTRRRSMTRRRYPSRRPRLSRRRTLSNYNKVYSFKRFSAAQTGFICSNTTETFFTINFSLNDIPGYTEFTAMFQLYKITGVKISVLPPQTVSNSLTSINNANPAARLFSCIDTTGNSYATINDMRQNQTLKYTSILRPHVRYLNKPKILDGSSYTISPWLSTSSPGTNYYGMDLGCEPTGSTTITTMTFSIECTFYLKFKGTK